MVDEDCQELWDPVSQKVRELVGDVLRLAGEPSLERDLEGSDAEVLSDRDLLLRELSEREAAEVAPIRREGTVVVEHFRGRSVLELVADFAEHVWLVLRVVFVTVECF